MPTLYMVPLPKFFIVVNSCSLSATKRVVFASSSSIFLSVTKFCMKEIIILMFMILAALLCYLSSSERKARKIQARGLFLESPETFRAYFGWYNSLCIFKPKASWGTKLCSYFYFYSLYNIWKDQLHRICRSEFYEWLFGPEKFSGLSRNGPLSRTDEPWPLQCKCSALPVELSGQLGAGHYVGQW